MVREFIPEPRATSVGISNTGEFVCECEGNQPERAAAQQLPNPDRKSVELNPIRGPEFSITKVQEILEALNRHRGKGQQRVTVEHVHVHQGAQAIVGNVHQGGGAPSKTEGQPHAPAITHEPGQTLPREVEEIREAMPSASG
jgi:hypothetical protein